MPKISSKLIKAVASAGVAAAIIAPISIGISNSTKEHKYNEYKGLTSTHSDDLALRESDDTKIPEILTGSFYFGNESVPIENLKDWQDLIKQKQTDEIKEQEKEITKKIDAQYEKLRSQKGINPTVILGTKIMTIKNDYFDMFGWGDTTDFFNWFINDVSWGPELLTLREFDIVRGVSKNGSMITLGGHSGTRESTLIKFYPDSFFGVQNIYDGTENSILVDTSNLGLSVNKDVIRDYINPFITKLKENSTALLSSDFETDPQISNLILNKKTVEDYIEIYDDKTISLLSGNSMIEGSTSDKETLAVDGGFPLLSDFLTYIHGEDTIKNKDTIKDSKGEVITVYPKRYLRRVLIAMYGYTSDTEIKNQDEIRKKVISGDSDFSEYVGPAGDVESIFDKLVDKNESSDMMKDNNVIEEKSFDYWGTPTTKKISVEPYSKTVLFKENPTIESIDSPYLKGSQKMAFPSIMKSFNNFNSELPESKTVEVGNIIRQVTKMNVVRSVTSADKGYDGKNKVTLLFEKYQNLIDTIKVYKEEHNWSPVKFSNGEPELNEFIPNLYLYKYQNREHGFLDFVSSSVKVKFTNEFDENEMNTATFIKEEIKKHGIDFNKELEDVNSPKTTKDPANGNSKKPTGESSYDDDLKKVVDDIPLGIDLPLVEKFFEYEAKSKTKIHKIGIEWLKYVASHEYGHHQTLQYAKDISDEHKKPTEGYTGVYDTKDSQIISGATINQHGYEGTYSRSYINEYLRSRTGTIMNLDPKQLKSGSWTKLDDEIATMQIDSSAAKDDPYFAFLFNNNSKNKFTKDETATDKPVEKGVYSYADFLTSWRAFKNPDQFLQALRIDKAALTKLRGRLDGESNIGYVAYLLNALDQASYSLNPTIMAPIAPFSEGTNRAIDPMTTDSAEASKINPLNIINGWTGFDGTDTSISPEIHSLNLSGGAAKYTTPYYKNGANPDDSIEDRLEHDKDGKVLKYGIPVPTAIVGDMLNSIKDITLDAPDADMLFDDKNILSPNAGGVAYASTSEVSDGIKYIGTKFGADFRKASDIYVNLKVDYSKGNPVYYLPDDTNAPKEASLEEVLVSSTAFKSVPLIGIMKDDISSIVIDAYNAKYGSKSFDAASRTKRYQFFKEYLINQLNAQENRKLSANLPIKQLADGKTSYTEWFEKGFGLEGVPEGQNEIFKKSYGEYLFQTYFKNFGRFLEYQKDYTGTTHNYIVPTTYLVTTVGTSKASTNKLNDVYASFLSQGSYSFYEQLMADYQVNLPETINRDLNQLIYTPSTKILQDGESTEAWTGINYALPPLFTTTFGSQGQVKFVSEMGEYDSSSKELKPASKQSGYFEDLALRRELDASLYILDIDVIEKYYRNEIELINDAITAENLVINSPTATAEEKAKAKIILDTAKSKQLLSGNGKPITNPDDWHVAFDEYGHPLTTAGKAMVNFYKSTSGATLDRDISAFFVDKYSGMGRIFGYISKGETEGPEGYDHVALVASDGSVQYIGITLNMSNQFFNKNLAVTGHGIDHKKVSIGEGYYSTDGTWIEYEEKDKQIGWASDRFLADGFSNSLLKEGTSYKMYFTHGESLTHKRPMMLGSIDTLSQDASGAYGTTHEPREVMYNNGFDVYSGKFEITRNDAGDTVIRVRKENDE